jgi:hypothetical protein
MPQVSPEEIASLKECIRQYEHEISWIDTVLNYRGLDGKTRNISSRRKALIIKEKVNLENILKLIQRL